ncbi:MAG: aminotransferase class V-fold PLP-dependent enzyme [Gemmatimonadota bacterium]
MKASNDIANYRTGEFSALGAAPYLNAASLGPLPRRSRLAIQEFNRRRSEVQAMTLEDFTAPSVNVRERAGRLIGADPAEIALGANTSFGINLAAAGLDLPPDSVVLVSDREFPANVYPWMNRQRLRLELVPVTAEGWPDEDRLVERVGSAEVRIVALSSVQFHNGYLADLARIGTACRAHDTVFVVDAIQSLGQIPLDVSIAKADIVATGGHKWLCGPFGAGFAYVRRELQNRLDPVAVGWLGMRASAEIDSLLDYRWDFVADARRFEVGTHPLQDHAGLAASLELLMEAGVDAIQRHIASLLQPLRDWLADHDEVRALSSSDPRRQSGIVSFRPPNASAVFADLTGAGVVCSLREGGIRVAPHFYNSRDDIGRVLEVLEKGARREWK